MIIEEAAYVSIETFKEIIAPLLGPSNVCLIALSTMGSEPSNFFTRLIKSGLLYVHAVSYVCKNCMLKGWKNVCPHNADSVPHWSGETRVELIRNILGDGSDEQFMRESLGVLMDDDEEGNYCFPKSKVEEMMANPRRSFDVAVRYIYVCIDPCAGSDNIENRKSDFAVVTMCEPYRTILGMEAFDAVSPDDYRHRLIEHIRRVRRIDMCEGATIILDVESGTGFEASHLTSLIREHFTHVVPMTDFMRKPGTKTDEAAKREMMNMTRVALDMGDVFFHKNFVTTSPDQAKLLKEFSDQMLNYSRVVSDASSNRVGTIVTYTGKTAEGKKDDLSMTFQRCIRAMNRFRGSVKYDKYRT